jgi:DNA polymerase-4
MRPLPVRKIHGVGPATESRLAAVGIKTCADILAMSRDELDQKLGRLGGWMWHAARGEDSRPVETSYDRKSFGREDTFEKDEKDLARIESRLWDLSKSVCASMTKRGIKGRTITLKVKYFDFESITRSRTIKEGTDLPEVVITTAMDLLKTKTAVGQRPIRLIGVSLSHLEQTTPHDSTQSRDESMSSTPSTSNS